MKKIIFVLALCALLVQFPSNNFASADDQIYYAQVRESDVAFYKTADESGAIFNLPASYFVEIYGKEGNFFKARYVDLVGYVKIGQVVVVNETPTIKYPQNAVITVDASLGVKLLSSPHFVEEDAPTIAWGESNITYYGTINGDKVNDNSNEWIYCKFNDKRGYIYANDCKVSITRITEPFTEFKGQLFTSSNSPSGLSTVAKVFIILGVSLPCALLIFLLIKPSLSGQVIKTKVKSKKRRHGDYFEFDENDLG